MANKEWAHLLIHPQLHVDVLHAHYVQHAYPRHSHDYYVVCVIEQGLQSFTHNGKKHYTPRGGVILINPGMVHTGEPADRKGFLMRSLYPGVQHLERAVFELTGHHQALPSFRNVLVDEPWARQNLISVHKTLMRDASDLEAESQFVATMAQLVKRYADLRYGEQRVGKESTAVLRVREYIEQNFSEGIQLSDLADHVSLSPYYLLRAFRAQVGMPPHAYLDTVRIRRAQQLIVAGKPLAAVALDVGYNSQSHLTRRFKQVIGVTPGQYAQRN